MKKKPVFYLTIPFVAVVTCGLVAVPLIAMQFTADVNWSMTDFVLMGGLIFGTGSLLVTALRSGMQLAYKAAVILAIGTGFLMTWANLAVGLIGSGPNIGNFLFAGVILILIIEMYRSQFKSAGMARALFVTTFSVVAVGVIALLMDLQSLPDSSLAEIIGITSFFAILYAVSGWLFRYATQNPATSN